MLSHSRSCKSHDAWKDIEGLGRITVKIKKGGLDLFYFSFHFYFLFIYFLYFHFLFLEQLELWLIGHIVTSVT